MVDFSCVLSFRIAANDASFVYIIYYRGLLC